MCRPNSGPLMKQSSRLFILLHVLGAEIALLILFGAPWVYTWIGFLTFWHSAMYFARLQVEEHIARQIMQELSGLASTLVSVAGEHPR